MPNYPSNFSDRSPFSAGPVSNLNLLYQTRDNLLKHNLLPVTRIITAPITYAMQPYQPIDWAVGPVKGWLYGINQYSGAQYGLNNGDIVILANQPSGSYNGIYQYIIGPAGQAYTSGIGNAATGSTGPVFARIMSLYSGSAFSTTVSGSNATVAISYATAQQYLNSLWQPGWYSGSTLGPVLGNYAYFGFTGSLNTGPGIGIATFLDQPGSAYPVGFVANYGTSGDNLSTYPFGVDNINSLIYFAQEQQITLGTTDIAFTSQYLTDTPPFQSPVPGQPAPVWTPSSYYVQGTPRLDYLSSTVNDFFIDVGIMAELLLLIKDFRTVGGNTDMPSWKKSYLINLAQNKIMRIDQVMNNMMDDLYQLYYLMWNLTFNFFGTTGSHTPSDRNRGYQIFNSGYY